MYDPSSLVKMASNPSAIRMPPLPTEPLPINALRTGLLYMYTCSQCDFKTHIESMFKQHVDYFHLGISRVSKSNPVFARASAPAGQSNPVVMAASPTASLGSQRLSAAAIAQLASVAAEQNQHKCLKCDFEATTKHKLNQHKRKNHGKNVPPSGAPQFEQVNKFYWHEFTFRVPEEYLFRWHSIFSKLKIYFRCQKQFFEALGS
jgi:hypothetical protein